jgi:hypothetical protein
MNRPAFLRHAAVDKFCQTAHAKAGPAFRALLRVAVPDPEVEPIREALIRCGTTTTREFAGQTYTKVDRCGLPYCPSCARRSRLREAKAVLRKVARIRAGVTAEHVSFITLHGGLAPLGADLRPLRDALAKQVHNVMRRRLRDYAISLQVQVAIHLDGEPQCHVHLHGILVHQGRSRHEVEAVMKQAFPKARAVQVQAPRSSKWEQEWVRPSDEYQGGEGMGVYSADLQPRMKRDRVDLPEVALAYVKSIESMRRQGRKGLRVQYGMNKRKVTDRILEGVSTDKDKVQQGCVERKVEQNTPRFGYELVSNRRGF